MTSKKHLNVTTNGSAPPSEKSARPQSRKDASNKQSEKDERSGIVLHKKPLLTLEYFAREVFVLTGIYGRKFLEFRKTVVFIAILTISMTCSLKFSGPQQTLANNLYKQLLWCLYWLGLGILSSVGLGTGLHTFLLYLGPHIAQVTIAAYECGSLNFPEPPYPDEVVCPADGSTSDISIWSIISKVRLESMCWGAGTALGELPPYFMARAARLSGIDPDDEDNDLAEFEELQRKKKEDLTLIEKGKLFVEDIVQKVGFLGILACASIPNPLFDLAGITCGHFLVPFWTFFGATLIGKALIKMHIQKLFVIIAFNEALILTALEWLKVVPIVGEALQIPFKTFLDDQKTKLHRKGVGGDAEKSGNILSSIFEKFVIAMVIYFVVSIVNSLAQSYHKRISKAKKIN
ncbi:vacuole membrane protein 1 isoform X2 [Onthophagus taurus]|nr:vacuole membrane protein 1 isoform X2 [Onthophagus taurus]